MVAAILRSASSTPALVPRPSRSSARARIAAPHPPPPPPRLLPPPPLGRREIQQDGRQHALALHPACGQLLHHLLEQHAFVRDVLIDNRPPPIVHGNDE